MADRRTWLLNKVSTHREILSNSYSIKPKSDWIYHFPYYCTLMQYSTSIPIRNLLYTNARDARRDTFIYFLQEKKNIQRWTNLRNPNSWCLSMGTNIECIQREIVRYFHIAMTVWLPACSLYLLRLQEKFSIEVGGIFKYLKIINKL